MTMTPEAVLRTWFEEVWNQGREDTIDRLLPADGIGHGLPGGELRGPEGFRLVYRRLRGALPDIRVDVERLVAQGDSVVAHCHVTGTHTGDGLGIPPTGRRIDFEGFTMALITDGQFREAWNCFDFLTMYQQLGVLPPLPG